MDLDQIAANDWLQVLTLLVTTCLAIGGAFLGARIGATATREATKEAIAAGRAADEYRRQAASTDAIRALAAECRLNARLLREVPRPHEAAAPSPFLERTVSDWALPAFPILPPDFRERTDRITNDVIYLNALLRQREHLSRRQLINSDFDQHIEAFARSLPDQLDTLAGELETFASKRPVQQQ